MDFGISESFKAIYSGKKNFGKKNLGEVNIDRKNIKNTNIRKKKKI